MRTLLVLASTCAVLSAQFVPPGYRILDGAIRSDFLQRLVRVDTGLVTYDQFRLRFEPDAGVARTLLEPPPSNGIFLAPLGPDEVVFAAGVDARIWRVPLAAGSTPRELGVYGTVLDGAVLDTDHVVVSRFGSGNAGEIALVDLRDGSVAVVIDLAGPPGPVAASLRGVWVAEVGATPRIRFFSRAAIRAAQSSGTPLGIGDALLESPTVGPVRQLAVDGDDDVWVMTAPLGDVWEHDFVAVGDDLVGLGRRRLLSYPAAVSGQGVDLQITPAPAGRFLDAFQLESSAAVVVLELTSPLLRSAWRRLTPLEAQTVAPATVPAGPFRIGVRDAAPDGMAFVAIGPVRPRARVEIRVGGFDVPLWWEVALLGTNADLLPVVLDAEGRGGIELTNPGFGTPVELTAATVFLDASGEVLAGTSPVVLELR